jgi:hypothetical protein
VLSTLSTVAWPNAIDPAVPPITIATSFPEGNVPVCTDGVVPMTDARILMPPAPEVIEPEVNEVRACPRLKLPEVVVAVTATTCEIVSPPLLGLIIENATGCPPRGLLDKSYTVAVKVEEPVVVPTLADTIVGDAWSTILAGAAPEDIATVKVS